MRVIFGRVYDDGGAWRFRFAREVVEVDDLICGKVAFDFRNTEIFPAGLSNNAGFSAPPLATGRLWAA